VPQTVDKVLSIFEEDFLLFWLLTWIVISVWTINIFTATSQTGTATESTNLTHQCVDIVFF